MTTSCKSSGGRRCLRWGSPPDAGTIICGRVVPIPGLVEPAQRLVSELGFQGICNIEFKKDAQTGEFKLIEINARPGMWNYSATASGINLAHIAFMDMVSQETLPLPPSPKELVWVMTIDDLWKSVRYWKRNGYSGYSIGLIEWWRSLQGKKVDPIYNMRDPGPWIFLIKQNLLIPILNKLSRKKRALTGEIP